MKTTDEIVEEWCDKYGHLVAFDGDAVANLRTALEEVRREERERIKQWAYTRATRCAACFGHEGIPHNHGTSDIADLLAFLTPTKTDKQ